MSFFANSQSVLVKEIDSDNLKTIVVDGNQIFNISVYTSSVDRIKMKSQVDGEYQSQFQIISKLQNDSLFVDLEQFSFTDIADDKRNAHKMVAVTLELEIPEYLNLNVFSDVGSVNLNGNFNFIFIELSQGYCIVKGSTNEAVINTIDGNISVKTNNSLIEASSNHGEVSIDKFNNGTSIWKLQSINGNIAVAKLE
ncbi:MAG: hypothetical protein CMC76_01770 [Flavobacteriaceae bacterium]|nr:hypothetical protein [Flavobacteriaceae bacterium]|tara:strand:+ start:192 stop:779 length:588 start_codon:yes stop_codon:yes gene_type:complete